MKVTIVGAGVAGSYLYSLLSKEHDVTVYDRDIQRRGHVCGWGCFYDELKEYLSEAGLKTCDYVLSYVDRMVVNGVPIKIRNQVTIDKPKMLRDLLPNERVIKKEVEFTSRISGDILVNATHNPLGAFRVILTYQAKVRCSDLEPNTAYYFIDPRSDGYAWCFPLDSEGREWHFGEGGTIITNFSRMRQFERLYKVKFDWPNKICNCARPVHVVNPLEPKLISYIFPRPISSWALNKVVSIGEAAGVVNPLSGEGIIDSLHSATVLAYHILLRNDEHEALKHYEKEMRSFLEMGKKTYDLYRLMLVHPRWAYLKAFNYTIEEARYLIEPEISIWTKLRLLREILFRNLLWQ